nr:MAG TPA: hypothetical protein [Caudoviricetes sp.]
MPAYRVQQSVKIPSVSCENATTATLQVTKPATRVSAGLPLASSPFSA